MSSFQGPPFSDRASDSLMDGVLQRNLRSTIPMVLHARNRAVAEIDNWEELRAYAHRVKMHTLGRLADYLEMLESAVEANGGQVFWADSAQDACRYVVELAQARGISTVVKSKTMLGEEIGINRALEQAGIEPVETDLGEFIVQLLGQPPSHLIAPALHLSRKQVADLFVDKVGMEPTDDVQEITRVARRHLRSRFLSARLGITGVNFAVAESGTVVVVENEGNARLSLSVPEVHVALMGIEKVLPRTKDLAVFLRLLVRSATGQRISSYVNFVRGARKDGEGAGPQEFHLVLVDNGRSRILSDPLLRQTLACIRCGACLNICPVYQTIGGHAYGSVYQGPIGAILTPQLDRGKEFPDHPFASSLCGACASVCPVKIDIPQILLELRHRARQDSGGNWESRGFELWSRLSRSPRWFSRAVRIAGLFGGLAKRFPVVERSIPLIRNWRRGGRTVPRPSGPSFRDQYRG